MNLYLDSSSLLKLFLEERESKLAEEIARRATAIYASLVAYVEARSGLARALRTGRLTEGAYRETLMRFEASWASFVSLDISRGVVRLAGDLAERHHLRGYDAVHLATAVTLQRELGEPVTFSAWDERLVSAAAAEGLTL